MENRFLSIEEKLKSFKKKFYANLVIKGIIISITVLFVTYILLNSAEFIGRFNSTIRLGFLLTFILAALYTLAVFIITPLIRFLGISRVISDEDAAVKIGASYPDIQDKLLNSIQLSRSLHFDSLLANAAITQKNKYLASYDFDKIIKIRENQKYLRFFLIPLLFSILIYLWIPNFFTDSSKRIFNYQKTFVDDFPFHFQLLNESFNAIRGEDFLLRLRINGSSIPSEVFLITDGRSSKMRLDSLGFFSFIIKNPQHNYSFFLEASGFQSDNYNLKVVSKPSIIHMNVDVVYPSYTHKSDDHLQNIGNLTVPEGTVLSWKFKTQSTDRIAIKFSYGDLVTPQKSGSTFAFTRKVKDSQDYKLELNNSESHYKEQISYNISVIKDQFPQIAVEEFKDSSLVRNISFAGNIGDDYGITGLQLVYNVKGESNPKTTGIRIPINLTSIEQKFYYQWQIDSLHLKPGNTLTYYFEVWDNDAVNGRKSTKTPVHELTVPSVSAIEKELSKNAKQSENSLEKMVSKSAMIKQELENIESKIKTKSTLNWQDKKNIQNILDDEKKSQSQIEQLKKNLDNLENEQEQFKKLDPQLKDKMDQLQKLVDELINEETKKLYEELQKLLEQNVNKEEIQNLLEKLQEKESSMENELKKALEMFKQLQFDQKLDDAIKGLDKLSKEQDELSEKALNKKSDTEELKKEQSDLNDKFQKVQDQLKDLNEINKDLENKKDLNNTDQKQTEVQMEQKKSLDQLNKEQTKKASDSQKSSSKKMEELSQQLKAMESSMKMKQMQENLKDLRAILENLVHLSFEEEDIMKEFRKINQSDPRFIALSQKQLKLRDDSKVIEDSLMALSRRVNQIQSFVTREVTQMKNYMDESSDALKERRVDIATGKQQFAMTSMNNLALMLDDVLKQMQQQMSQAMSSGNKSCSNPQNKPGENPGLGEMQKQLNQKIQQLQKGGKSGKELSEELAKLAAQQEMIRRALQSMERKSGEKGRQPGGNYGDLKKNMENTEADLVNKRLTQEMLSRQKEILTRLLEAENSMRERELDEKREAEHSKSTHSSQGSAFEKYFKDKQKEIDLLKTIPPQLNNFYKQETNNYFQKITQ